MVRIDVDDVPPPSGDPAGASGETPPNAPPKSEVVDEGVDPRWSPQDLRDLIEIVKQMYRGTGEFMGGDAGPRPHPEDPSQELVGWMEITDAQARMIAVPMTWWVPVGWIRGGKKGSPILGAIATVVAVGIVTKPKIDRYNRERRVQREPQRDVRGLAGDRADAHRAATQDAERGDRRNGEAPTDVASTVRPRSAREFLRPH
jgi:hypothetical protein